MNIHFAMRTPSNPFDWSDASRRPHPIFQVIAVGPGNLHPLEIQLTLALPVTYGNSR